MRHETTSYLFLDRDDDIDSLKAKLFDLTNPKTTIGFDLSAKLLRMKGHYKGRYAVEPEASMMSVLRMVRNHAQSPVKVVVPSVRTMPDLAGRVAKQLMIDSIELVRLLTSDSVMASLGYDQQTFPGMMIPNTYEMYWDVSADNFLLRMKKENDNFWNKERQTKAQTLGLNANQVATLASIVDSESAYNPEKPRIAGLYINRIKKGMLLQSDPTVIYAIGDFTIRRVLNRHLEELVRLAELRRRVHRVGLGPRALQAGGAFQLVDARRAQSLVVGPPRNVRRVVRHRDVGGEEVVHVRRRRARHVVLPERHALADRRGVRREGEVVVVRHGLRGRAAGRGEVAPRIREPRDRHVMPAVRLGHHFRQRRHHHGHVLREVAARRVLRDEGDEVRAAGHEVGGRDRQGGRAGRYGHVGREAPVHVDVERRRAGGRHRHGSRERTAGERGRHVRHIRLHGPRRGRRAGECRRDRLRSAGRSR